MCSFPPFSPENGHNFGPILTASHPGGAPPPLMKRADFKPGLPGPFLPRKPAAGMRLHGACATVTLSR